MNRMGRTSAVQPAVEFFPASAVRQFGGMDSNKRQKLLQIQLVAVSARAGHGNASQENSSSWFAIVRQESNRRHSCNRMAMRGGDCPPSEPRTCNRTSFAPEATSPKRNKRNREQMKTEQNQRS